MSLFSWLRSQVKSAVLGGVQDALDDLHRLPHLPAVEPVVLRLDGGVESEAGETNGRQKRQEARGR